MKSLSLSFNIILLLAVAGLYYLHFAAAKSQVNPSQKIAQAVVAPKMDLKSAAVVFVNSDSLMDNY